MQELLIIRHALAHERNASKWPDDEQRPLSLDGRRRFRRFAALLSQCVPTPDIVLSSPLRRARQTARILRRRADFPKSERCALLSPEANTGALIRTLNRHNEQCIAIVGHEPDLTRLVTTLLGADRRAGRCRIKKGALVWLSFKHNVQTGRATLVAYLPTRLARRR